MSTPPPAPFYYGSSRDRVVLPAPAIAKYQLQVTPQMAGPNKLIVYRS
jgi:hypothetical protein